MSDDGRGRAPAGQDRERLRPFHWRIAIIAGLAFSGNGVDAGVVSFALPGVRTEWGLSTAQLGALLPTIGLGQLIGAIACGALADRFGRRWLFCTTGVLAGLGTGVAGLARDPTMLALSLFVGGLGFGAVAPVAGALVSEFAPSAYRGRLIGVTQILWVLGWSLASVAGGWFGEVLGWRGILAVGAAPIAVGLVGYVTVPESPRFLLARGRPEEAAELLGRMSRRHGVTLAIGKTTTREPSGRPWLSLGELWSRRYRRRTLALWLTWVAMNAAYTGPITWLPVLLAGMGSGQAFKLSALVGFSMLPATILSTLLIDQAGRKPLMVASLGLAGLGAALLAVADSAPAATAGAMGLAGGVLAAWPVVLSWSAELYPTRIRASASGWGSGFARLGSMSAPATLGYLLGLEEGGRLFAVAPFAALLGGAVLCVAVLAQETAGRTLEEASA